MPTALLILMGVILTPIAIKALFYFVLAPLAARRPPVSIRAAADNNLGALVVGLDVRRLYAFTFGVGAACVGAAGALTIGITRVVVGAHYPSDVAAGLALGA